ncbi:hypothetical protein [Bacillus sp. M6-12]|nr:hypothetical protein [Bacillus sp. M6-12]
MTMIAATVTTIAMTGMTTTAITGTAIEMIVITAGISISDAHAGSLVITN